MTEPQRLAAPTGGTPAPDPDDCITCGDPKGTHYFPRVASPWRWCARFHPVTFGYWVGVGMGLYLGWCVWTR